MERKMESNTQPARASSPPSGKHHRKGYIRKKVQGIKDRIKPTISPTGSASGCPSPSTPISPTGDGYTSSGTPTTMDHGAPLGTSELPKDDESMARDFQALNDRLRDHVLNFYIPPDDTVREAENEKAGSGKFDHIIKDFGHLLAHEPRVFILHAIIANIVIKEATKAVKKQKPESSSNGYQQWKTTISESVGGEMGPFANPKQDPKARSRSMETLLGLTYQFILTMEKQQDVFELIWPNNPAELINETMEVVCRVPREDPDDIPVETPMWASGGTPIETLVGATPKALVETPAGTPAETPKDTPTEETSAGIPRDTSTGTIVGSLRDISTKTLAGAASTEALAGATSIETPTRTPRDTPTEAPADIIPTGTNMESTSTEAPPGALEGATTETLTGATPTETPEETPVGTLGATQFGRMLAGGQTRAPIDTFTETCSGNLVKDSTITPAKISPEPSIQALKVQAIVFPGLKKKTKSSGLTLVKAQVLTY